MINSEELLFAVDENNQPIEPVKRSEAHATGVWHRTTDIVVVNSQNQILVSKRSMKKDTGPGQWNGSFGGHVLAGMDVVDSAVEELAEECGLKVKREDLEFVGTN